MSCSNSKKPCRVKKPVSLRLKTILISAFAFLWFMAGIGMQLRFAETDGKGLTERMGDFVQFAVPATGLAGALLISDYRGAGQFALGCLTNLGITTGLKHGITTTRPNGRPHSFPSGHTSFAFQGAAFIQRRYGWKLGLLAYLASGFVGFSRVDANMHHMRDVVAGAALGIACGYIFTRPYDRKPV